jgi:predicted dehydrogenase
MSIDAVEAGKDVYVEKPMALTVEDGFRMVEAVRRTGRVLQVGTQRRSSEICEEARDIVASGTLGTVRLLNCWWHGKTGPRLGARKLEGHLDWDQWLGSAPRRPLDPTRFFSWVWFWDYGGGYMVGQTVHILDATHMFMNPGYPVAVTALGKHTLAGADIPETTSISIEYPEYLAVFTVGYKAMRYNPPEMSHELKQIHGASARLDVGRETMALYDENPASVDLQPRIERRKYGAIERSVRSHIRDFLDCVRSRKDPRATVEAGNLSTVVLAMASESLRSGRTVRFDPGSRRMV